MKVYRLDQEHHLLGYLKTTQMDIAIGNGFRSVKICILVFGGGGVNAPGDAGRIGVDGDYFKTLWQYRFAEGF